MSESPWPTIHAEREALLEDLAGLSAEQWNTPSLCPNWSVSDVVGHMTATARMTPGRFFGHFIGAGFKFHQMSAKDVAAETAQGHDHLLAEFRAVSSASTAPPGPIDAMLGEAIVHPADIRRPLGIAHDYPLDAVCRAADFYAGSNLLIGSKKRIEGLKLRATDTEWTHGEGPEVTGPAMSLLQAMTGRGVALDDLSGAGLTTLRSRF